MLNELLIGISLAASIHGSTTPAVNSKVLQQFSNGTSTSMISRTMPVTSSDRRIRFANDPVEQWIVEIQDRFPRAWTVEASQIHNEPRPDELRQFRPVQSQSILWMRNSLKLKWSEIAKINGVSRQCATAWSKGKNISATHFENLLGVADVLRRAQKHYPTESELRAWLFGFPGNADESPASLLASGCIAKARMLAIENPGESLSVLPDWAILKPDEWQKFGTPIDEVYPETDENLTIFEGDWVE